MSLFGLAVLVLEETVICDSYINRPALRRGQAAFAHLKSLWLGTNGHTHEKSSRVQHLLFLNASKLCCHLQNYKPQQSIYPSYPGQRVCDACSGQIKQLCLSKCFHHHHYLLLFIIPAVCYVFSMHKEQADVFHLCDSLILDVRKKKRKKK